nr:NUDIX domain-containing protein [Sanguibacter gelidistatuariae]
MAGSSAPAVRRPADVTVATVCLRSTAGLLLTVRKRGTSTFMLPGGKPDPGEPPRAAACREVHEELGLILPGHSLSPLGTWRAPAANEAGAVVEATVFRTSVVIDHAQPAAEIEEVAWIDVHAPSGLTLAPMLTEHVLPALRRAEGASMRGATGTPTG